MALAKGLRSAATALSRSALRQEAIFGQIRVVSGSAPCAAQELNSETSSQTVGESQVRQVSPHFKSNITGGEYFMSTPVYTSEELDRVVPRHRPTESLRDRVANSLVAAARRLFDWITDYGEGKMDERKWLTRFIFLESVAGVPGMVGGAVRHLRSIGLLRRDHGWINTLLSEAENVRGSRFCHSSFRRLNVDVLPFEPPVIAGEDALDDFHEDARSRAPNAVQRPHCSRRLLQPLLHLLPPLSPHLPPLRWVLGGAGALLFGIYACRTESKAIWKTLCEQFILSFF